MARFNPGGNIGRPQGRLDLTKRAPRGSKAILPGTLVAGYTSAGSDYIAANIQTAFEDFDDQVDETFIKLVHTWAQKVFTPRLRSAIRATMWQRSGRMQQVEAGVTGFYIEGGERQIVVSAQFPDDEMLDRGFALEMGRASGAPKGKYYLVPLATWVMRAGASGKERKYMTHAEIARDMARPGTFMPKQEFRTKAGPARIIFLRHPGKRRFKQSRKTGRFQKLGPKSKSKLSEVATAMYLAYKKTTAIYGSSGKTGQGLQLRKTPKRSLSPLAAQFALVNKRPAPKWFSHAAAGALLALHDAVTGVQEYSDAASRAIITPAAPSGQGRVDALDGLSDKALFKAASSRWMDATDAMIERLSQDEGEES